IKTFSDLFAIYKDPARTGYAAFRVASAGYFRAMGIPLVRGRLFDERDGGAAPHVALISESLARQRWPNEDPIGIKINYAKMDGDFRPLTVIGVVADIKEGGLDAAPIPTVYGDYRQRPLQTFDFTVVLQSSVSPTSLMADARRVLQQLMPEMAPQFRTI